MKLKELRKRNNLSQQEIANKLGINNVTYYGYEKGRSEPSIKTLIQLADIYGVSLDYLCDHISQTRQELGYLNETQLQIMEMIKQLNETNTIKALSYIGGLLAAQ